MTTSSLGKYTHLELLGSGSFGFVYKARDPLGWLVAVKVLMPVWMDDDETVVGFRCEAQAAGELFHTRIASILDFDQAAELIFLVMRYVDDPSLNHLEAQRGPLPWPEALRVLSQVAEALDYAHQRGMVHRDVKPANILVSASDGAVLTDFGLVKAVQSSGLTSSGAMLGTPNYIAPEVWLGQPVSPASDVYSLACVFFEMLTGQLLFAGDSTPHVMTRHVLEGPKLPEEWPEGVPAGVAKVMEQALAKVPEQRLGSVIVLGKTLERLMHPDPGLSAKPALPTLEWAASTVLEEPAIPEAGLSAITTLEEIAPILAASLIPAAPEQLAQSDEYLQEKVGTDELTPDDDVQRENSDLDSEAGLTTGKSQNGKTFGWIIMVGIIILAIAIIVGENIFNRRKIDFSQYCSDLYGTNTQAYLNDRSDPYSYKCFDRNLWQYHPIDLKDACQRQHPELPKPVLVVPGNPDSWSCTAE